AERQTVNTQAQDRISRRRLEVQPTEMVQIPEEPAAPGEQDPVGPAVIPEPYPPPDEGDPPQPAIIPEPGPAVIPEPGPQGPEGRDSYGPPAGTSDALPNLLPWRAVSRSSPSAACWSRPWPPATTATTRSARCRRSSRPRASRKRS